MSSQLPLPLMRGRVVVALTLLAVVLLFGTACGGAGEGPLPPDVQDPSRVRTPAGAMGFYSEVLASVPALIDQTVAVVGVLTDELAALPLPVGVEGSYTAFDSRQDLTQFGTGELYGGLHTLRAQAREARNFLLTYAPDSAPALTGHLAALEGYAEIVLADLYCSGIPLSTVDFGGDYTLTPGFSTAEVYSHALALLDTAFQRTADSARLQLFTAVGRGRALLGLGRFADAATAVAAVPDNYAYQVVLTKNLESQPLTNFASAYLIYPGQPSVADQEGGSGLDYRSSNDPRTASQPLGQDVHGYDMYFPLKYYPVDAPRALILASGTEARLIEAEAALQAGGDWVAKLNALRTDGTFDTQPNVGDPSRTDTLWHAGSGGVAGLRPLDDPGTPNARVDLLFRERAFWLYLTGQRQGDLRRLIRQYQRVPTAVYPSGFYRGGGGQYGNEITIPVPAAEREYNPKYTGCIHHNA